MRVKGYYKTLLEKMWQEDEKKYTFEASEPLRCLRCGGYLDRHLQYNSLSRYAQVYICPDCGMNEAILDMLGKPLLLSRWYAVQKKLKNINIQKKGVAFLKAECNFPEIFTKDRQSVLERPSQEVAYCRADYDGSRWWRKWFYAQERPVPSALELEMGKFVNGLFEMPELHSLKSMKRILCSQAQPVSETEFNLYSETEHFWIWMRTQTMPYDYNLWIHFYEKEEDSHNER